MVSGINDQIDISWNVPDVENGIFFLSVCSHLTFAAIRVDVYTLHKPARRNYKRSRVIVPGIDAQF